MELVHHRHRKFYCLQLISVREETEVECIVKILSKVTVNQIRRNKNYAKRPKFTATILMCYFFAPHRCLLGTMMKTQWSITF